MKWLALVAVLVLVRPARADEALGTTAFQQAEELRKKGQWGQACQLYRISNDADPQLGVLLHLADCNQHINLVATAWAEFTDAIDLAHQKGDPREAVARKRAAALAPRVSKLHIAPPATPIPGLVVHRDAADITAVLGTDMPIDPGEHVIGASAPGYVDWRLKVTIVGAGGTTPLSIPPLDKAPDNPVATPSVVHEGTLRITTQLDATIFLDTQRVAKGTYDAKVPSGPHTVRVIAAGMRPFQTEVYVHDAELAAVAPQLEAEPLPRPAGPSFEMAASAAPGKKFHGVHEPGVIAYRAELGFRIGPRVNLGAFVELGSIDASDTCGLDMPGPSLSSPFDYGTHYQMTRCRYVTPGVQLYVHVLPPHHRIDPYAGVAPGLRFGLTSYTPYLAGVRMAERSEIMTGFLVGARIGLDIHPQRDVWGWAVGPFVEAQFTLYGTESCDCDGGTAGRTSFTSLFGGIRSSLAF